MGRRAYRGAESLLPEQAEPRFQGHSTTRLSSHSRRQPAPFFEYGRQPSRLGPSRSQEIPRYSTKIAQPTATDQCTLGADRKPTAAPSRHFAAFIDGEMVSDTFRRVATVLYLVKSGRGGPHLAVYWRPSGRPLHVWMPERLDALKMARPAHHSVPEFLLGNHHQRCVRPAKRVRYFFAAEEAALRTLDPAQGVFGNLQRLFATSSERHEVRLEHQFALLRRSKVRRNDHADLDWAMLARAALRRRRTLSGSSYAQRCRNGSDARDKAVLACASVRECHMNSEQTFPRRPMSAELSLASGNGVEHLAASRSVVCQLWNSSPAEERRPRLGAPSLSVS